MKETNDDPPCSGRSDERWRPALHQRYFLILGDGNIRVFPWSDMPFDYGAWQFGNCFKTRREAEHAREAIRQALRAFHAEYGR